MKTHCLSSVLRWIRIAVCLLVMMPFVGCKKQESPAIPAQPTASPVLPNNDRKDISGNDKRIATPNTGLAIDQTYFDSETGNKISVVSGDEIEIQRRDANLICKYSMEKNAFGGDRVRLVATAMGTTQTEYLEVADGMLENDSQCFVLARSIGEARNMSHGGRASRCVAYAHQVWLACKLYADDHNGVFPPSLAELIPEYTQSDQIFKSPYGPPKKPDFTTNTITEPYKALKDFVLNSTDYQYFGGTERDPINKVLLRCKYTSSDGKRTVIYVNGAGERIVR